MDDASDTDRFYQHYFDTSANFWIFCVRILVQHFEQKIKCLQNLKICQRMDSYVQSTLGIRETAYLTTGNCSMPKALEINHVTVDIPYYSLI